MINLYLYRKKITTRYLLILLVLLFQNIKVSAQESFTHFDFNINTVSGWTMSGPYNEDGLGPIPSNFSNLKWDDSANASYSSIYDMLDNNLGALSFSALNGHGIEIGNNKIWIMKISSPDLSNSPHWFSALGFDIFMAQDMSPDSNIWVDLSIIVMDKDNDQLMKITKTGEHRLIPDAWNITRFYEWKNLPEFPQNYSVLNLLVEVKGLVNEFYSGNFYLDNLKLLPGRNLQVQFPNEIIGETYEMISFPFNIYGSFENIFTDDYGIQNSKNWRVFRWNETIGDYLEYPSLYSNVKPGLGFWFIKRSSEGFDIEFTQPVSIHKTYKITLLPGWNQIGNPFPFPVSWNDINFSNPIDINCVNKWISATEEYQPGQSVLEPWVGYFVDNQFNEPVYLEISPIESSGEEKPFLSNFNFGEGEFVLQLKLKNLSTLKTDNYNYIGMLNKAEGNDDLDFREAPPPIRKNNLSIINEGKKYSGSFIPVNKEGVYWDINISNINYKQNNQLSFSDLTVLPENFSVWVLDLENKNSIPINNGIISLPNSWESNYRIIVGTKLFAENNNNDINLTPFSYMLYQNHPNPFNPITTIQYSLQIEERVTLIIYDLLGKEINILIDDEHMKSGLHKISWDGRNRSGSQVSSGIYFYRLVTDNFSEIKKMILLK